MFYSYWEQLSVYVRLYREEIAAENAMKIMQTVGALVAVGILIPVYADDADDVAALKALDQDYKREWMESDSEGVMSLFTQDATLVPHHGDDPVVGAEAIRAFWFDPSYSPTKVIEWSREPREVFVLGDVGVVRGRGRLTFEYDGTRTKQPESNYVLIAVRQDDGWRIRMLTWNDDPRDVVREPVDANGG